MSFSSTTLLSTSVAPTTSADGAVGYTTFTTYIVQSSAATTVVSPYTTDSNSAAANSATTQPGSGGGKGGGLSTGAKAGIGAGVGVAVLAALIFGLWYSWFMRKRRRRSISASDRYPPSSVPSMMGGYGAVGGAVGAGHMSERSAGRSELPSPPIGSSPRSPDFLVPPGAAAVSKSQTHSSQSISDYSGNEGRPPGSDHGEEKEKGYFAPAGSQTRHEMGDNERSRSPPQAYGHQRTFSGGSISQPSDNGTTLAGHSRNVSKDSPPYQSPEQNDGYWQNAPRDPAELQGSGVQQAPAQLSSSPPREGYRGMDPEVPLHQRMSNDRPPPFRVGHLQKQQQGGGGYGPSQNF